jgi:1A family penicillin-binding protein
MRPPNLAPLASALRSGRKAVATVMSASASAVLDVIRSSRAALLTAVLVVSLGAWTGVGASVWYLQGTLSGLPDQAAVRGAGTMARATTLADAKGQHAFTIFEEQRLHVPLARVSPQLVNAILAIEDRRFYDHHGIDPIRIVGAALNNVVEMDREQGGSTITQQLARLTLLTPDKTLRRKLREAILATRLERIFSKDEILELYLNKAYFGDGLYGVEAASLGYFGKHASEVGVAEAALIAGLVKSPSTYAPTVSPDRAVARRNLVLQAMRGTGAIDDTTYQSAVKSPLRLNDTLRREEAFGQYFKEEVRKWLVQTYGWERVYHGGLRVETTIDLDLQKAAEVEIARALEEIEQRQLRRRRPAPRGEMLQAALIAIDPRTGQVRAMVGGRAFERSPFNRATQSRRQPGSAFKPFVYAAALERGYTPATLITGLSEPVMTPSGWWLPEDGHLESDAITMRAALRTSSNRAAVRMLRTIGIPAAVEYAQHLGVGTMPHVPSLALGSGEVTLLSLTSAFGAFANEGRLATPSFVRTVTTGEGQVIHRSIVQTREAVSPATAFLISSMLQDVINAGTAWQARQIGFRLPAAGKTGTTNDYRDAWFVGYTPNLVTGVWIGYDQPRTIVSGGYAAELAVPLWARFMMAATRNDKASWFRAPSTVTVAEICRVSGRLATDSCRSSGSTHTEYFARGTQPIDTCLVHRDNVFRGFTADNVLRFPGAPPVVASRDTRAPAPPAAPAAATPAASAAPEAVEEAPAKKKRGFWSRLFGKGGDKKEKK